MKKGKTAKINGYKNFKTIYGTVDSKEFKSLYLNIQTWVEPKKSSENWNRVVLNMSREVKHSVYNTIDKKIFDEKFIVDLDLRTSGLQVNKKSFMNLEINLYLIEKMDFKSIFLKNSLKKILKNIKTDVLDRNEYFNFYLTKNGNSKPQKVKIEKV